MDPAAWSYWKQNLCDKLTPIQLSKKWKSKSFLQTKGKKRFFKKGTIAESFYIEVHGGGEGKQINEKRLGI